MIGVCVWCDINSVWVRLVDIYIYVLLFEILGAIEVCFVEFE